MLNVACCYFCVGILLCLNGHTEIPPPGGISGSDPDFSRILVQGVWVGLIRLLILLSF